METNINITEKTVSKIMYDKFKNVLANSTFKQISKSVWICTGTLALTSFLTFPEESIVFLKEVLKTQNFIVLKLIFSFLFFYNLENIINFFKTSENIEDVQTIEGIPTLELIDHLFIYKTFKREEIESIFGISRNRFDILAKKLDDLQVLIRGANNARILNLDMSRQEVVKILYSGETAKQLKQTFFETSKNCFSAAPVILKNIKNNLSSLFMGDNNVGQFTKNPIKHTFVRKAQKDCEIRKNLNFTLDMSNLYKSGDPVFPASQYENRKIKIDLI